MNKSGIGSPAEHDVEVQDAGAEPFVRPPLGRHEPFAPGKLVVNFRKTLRGRKSCFAAKPLLG